MTPVGQGQGRYLGTPCFLPSPPLGRVPPPRPVTAHGGHGPLLQPVVVLGVRMPGFCSSSRGRGDSLVCAGSGQGWGGRVLSQHRTWPGSGWGAPPPQTIGVGTSKAGMSGPSRAGHGVSDFPRHGAWCGPPPTHPDTKWWGPFAKDEGSWWTSLYFTLFP